MNVAEKIPDGILGKPMDRIIRMLPQKPPFLFVDEILEVDKNSLLGAYRFKKDAFFYQSHLSENPVTPEAFLTETLAQIGLLAFGIYLLEQQGEKMERRDKLKMILLSSEVRFKKLVLPGERVLVRSVKVSFQRKQLKCKVSMKKENQLIVCRGTLSGMFVY